MIVVELFSGAEVDAWEIAPLFSELLANTGVEFVQDRVKLLHPSDHWGTNGPKQSSCGGTVLLESGLLIEYDWYNFITLTTNTNCYDDNCKRLS